MRLRFVAAFVGVMVVVLAAVGIPLARHLRTVEAERLTAELQRDAFNLASAAVAALASSADSDIGNLRSSADVYAASSGADVVVTDAAGVAVVTVGDAARPGDDLSARADVQSALAGSPAAGRSDEVFVAVPVRSGAETVGVVLLVSPTALVDGRADDKLRGLAVVGLISLAAAVIAALFMAGTLIGPLRRLQRTTERVAAGDFDSRSAIGDGPPEVRHLAASFDAMTARIAQLLEQQRAFASDASHQLLTPLTALRLQLERAAETVDTDPVGARRRLEAAGVETERLQRMVEGLLLLARSDVRKSATETVDAGLVAVERADIWRPLAAERNIGVDQRVTGDVTACVVPGALEQIIDNYLDNAITIAPSGTVDDVVVGRRDGWIEIHVLDRGPGLTDEQIEHAFDRFWRAPDAPHDGSGLGLAIVRHLANASGGSVALMNRRGGGIDAGLRLPAAGVAGDAPARDVVSGRRSS